MSVTAACVNVVRDCGTNGVIFPRLADLVMRRRFDINPFGDETLLWDADRPNAVCWNYASREFVDVINSMLDHPAIQMVRTTAQRYYDHGAGVEIYHDTEGDECIPMPPVDGDIAGGYETPHWVPTAVVSNAGESPTAG